MVTQPLMYKKIAQHPGTRKLYADKLVDAGGASQRSEAGRDGQRRTATRSTAASTPTRPMLSNYKPPFAVDWAPYIGAKWTDADDTQRAARDAAGARRAARPRCREGFKLHPRVEQIIDDAQADGARASCRSTGAWPRPSPTRRCSTKATPCGCPARTRRAARSSTATRCCTTRTGALGPGHLRAAAAHRARTRATSWSSTRCCPRRRCSASSTATRPPSPTRSSSGKRSSATSRTARRW